MKIVFVLGDGRVIEMPDNVQLTCPDPGRNPQYLAVSDANGRRLALINDSFPCSIRAVQDDSVAWCEELWKLEDKR